MRQAEGHFAVCTCSSKMLSWQKNIHMRTHAQCWRSHCRLSVKALIIMALCNLMLHIFCDIIKKICSYLYQVSRKICSVILKETHILCLHRSKIDAFVPVNCLLTGTNGFSVIIIIKFICNALIKAMLQSTLQQTHNAHKNKIYSNVWLEAGIWNKRGCMIESVNKDTRIKCKNNLWFKIEKCKT